MKEIKDYRLKDFLSLREADQIEYTRLLSYTKPIDTKKSLWDLKYKHVDRLKTEGLEDFNVFVDIVSKLQRINKKDVWNLRITEFFGLLNSLKEQLSKLVQAEKSLAPREPNVKWEAVNGSQRMAKFGSYNTLIPLAAQLNTTIEAVNNMAYSEVFTIKLYNTTMGDIHKEMQGLKI